MALVFLFMGLLANAQSQAEKTLLKSASKQFEAREYLSALPSYSQLLSIAPENKDYNFKYGVCLLATDEDVDKSLSHLKYVCSDGNFEDTRAYFYLGKAYHLNYQFAAALRSYDEFKSKVDSKTANDFPEVDRLITMAENGKKLMSDIKDIRVIDKTESTAGDFFRNYDMGDMGGSVIKVPEELLSSLDKKRAHSPIMFFPEGGGEIIFSSYGSGDHLELYSVERTSDGGFSKPKKLAGVVNSPYDEDYPFLHSDGRTLYFSSKGHNSMGGYDVFKSKRDLSTGVFDTPVNLDFAISSPDDDIFYMVDRDKRIANFASDRSSETGRLHVYKVAVSNASLEMAIIQGKLINSTGGNAIAQIRVLDANTDEEIGVYITDEEGNYLIDLPGTGKYKFFVEAEDSEVLHTGLVDVPSFGKIKAFKQEMVLLEEATQEKLIIKNQFDEEVDVDITALIQEVVKQKAQLDVNFEGEPEPAAAEEEEPTPVLTESDLVSRAGYAEDVTIESIVSNGQQQSALLTTRISAESIERDKSYARAIEQIELSESLMQEAEQLYESAQSSASADEKEELILKTLLKRAEAEKAAHDATIALVLAKEFAVVIDQKASVQQELELRNASIEAATASNDQEQLIAGLEQVKSFDDKAVVHADALDAITQRSLESNREAAKVIDRVEDIRTSRTSALTNITTKETQLEKTKKQKDLDILEAELNSLRAEVADIDLQLGRAATRLIDTQTEADNAVGAVTLLEQMRVGTMEELASLQPLPIPEGGLDQTGLRLSSVRTKAANIEVSKEELGRIMQSRPELLSSLAPSEKQLLQEITSDENNIVSEGVAQESISNPTTTDSVAGSINDQALGSTTDSAVGSTTDAITNPALETTTDSAVSSTTDPAVVSATESAILDEESTTKGTSEVVENIEEDIQNPREEILPTIQEELAETGLTEEVDRQVEEETSIAQNTADETVEEETSPDAVQEFEDYSNLSPSDLLTQLQADYASARNDIESSDMFEIEKARANIDLNRAAVQVIDQKIIDLKYSSDFAENETKQGNVKAMQQLVNELEAEMLIIAAETETPLFPIYNDTSVTEEEVVEAVQEVPEVDASNPREETLEGSSTQIAERSENESMAAQIGKSEELKAMQSKLFSIENDSDKTDVVKAISRINTRASFVQELKSAALNDPTLQAADKELISTLIIHQNSAIDRDIQKWQIETGTRLTPTELVLAKNDEEYIAKRTLLETSGDDEGVKSLSLESARIVSKEADDLAVEGIQITDTKERRLLQDIILAGADIKLEKSYEVVYSELSPITEGRTWIPELFTDKRLQQQVMALREEIEILPIYGDSDEDRFREHIELNNELAAPLKDEMLWKEEELRVASKRKEVPAEVTQLIEDSYELSSRAVAIREESRVHESQTMNAEMLTKASLLDLAALDKLKKAQQLQKHLSKKRDRTLFEYREALVINSRLLLEETDAYVSSTSINREEIASNKSTEDISETVTENVAEPIEEVLEDVREVEEEISQPPVLVDIEEEIPVEVEDTVEEETALNAISNTQEDTESAALQVDSDPIDNEGTLVISDISQLDDLEPISSAEAIRNYPQLTADLSEEDILPILSFEEEISLMSEQEAEVSYDGDWDITKADPDQLRALERKGIVMDKHSRYQAELEETVAKYQEEKKKRTVRLAEVIDQMPTSGGTEEQAKKAQRLTTEIQIIDAYSRQAEENISTTEVKLVDLESERNIIVKEIEESVALLEEEEPIAEDFEIIEELSPDVVIEETPPVENTEIVEEVVSIPEETFEEEPIIPVVAPDYEAFIMPEVLTDDLFRVSAANTERKRSIPVGITMPSGTIYQVQVGAFRNPIPEAHFSEFDPIMGTRLANGITRYKVGLFQDEATAIVARDQIRGLGYSDAFVVKYIDGTRAGIVNAAGIAITPTVSSETQQGSAAVSGLDETATSTITSESSTELPASSESESTTDVIQSPTSEGESTASEAEPNTSEGESGTSEAESSTSRVESNAIAATPNPPARISENAARSARPLSEYDSDNSAYYEEAINAAPATQVERIEGLFFTVQVGVYSKPVTLASIFSINPLNSDLTESGKIRYTSGIFDDFAVAEQWKQKIQARGVADAFVTAYYNGNRITIAKAREILAFQGPEVLVAIEKLSSLDADRQGQAVWEMVSTSELFGNEVEEQIDFKIRMGPYYERIPDKDVKVILDFENNVDYGQLDDGAITYTTKGRMSYDQAQEWRERFLKLGITNANIIALKNGEEVSVKQALDFLLK